MHDKLHPHFVDVVVCLLADYHNRHIVESTLILFQLRIMEAKIEDQARDKTDRDTKHLEWNTAKINNGYVCLIQIADELLYNLLKIIGFKG